MSTPSRSRPLGETQANPGRQAIDLDLMQRIVQREQYALMVLYERFGNLVYSLAVQVMRDQAMAEEITQDTFLKVWRQAEKWDPEKGMLSSWLLTVTKYTAIDRLRKERRQPTIDSEPLDESNPMASTGQDYGTELLWHDGQLLRDLIAQLPKEQAEAIHLAFFYGLSHSQLAEQLGLPLGTVKTRLRLGLEKLRALWGEAARNAEGTS